MSETMRTGPSDAYASIVQLVVHAEAITWNRFYNFLMGNTLLILGWATLFAASSACATQSRIAQAALCVLGALSGIPFAALSYRGRKYLMDFVDLGAAIENSVAWPADLPQKPLGMTVKTRGEYPFPWAGSYFILTGSCLLFTVLHLLLLFVSIGVKYAVITTLALIVACSIGWVLFKRSQKDPLPSVSKTGPETGSVVNSRKDG